MFNNRKEVTYSNLKITPFHNQPQPHSVLYRYVTIDKLLDFLFGGRIALTRLNAFEDKLEGVDINHLLLNYVGDSISQNFAGFLGETVKYLGSNINLTNSKSLSKQRKIFQEANYASCWFLSEYESVAMWQLYSRPDSVAIRIPYKNLENELLNGNFELPPNVYQSIKYGRVDYHRFSKIESLDSKVLEGKNQGFIKDLSFQHEQEFRILIQIQLSERKSLDKKTKVPGKQVGRLDNGLDVKVIHLIFTNFKTLPFEIIFHPKSFAWHRENIIKILEKFELPFRPYESALTDIFN